LTFTRASGATRVASNGLIEKVRTNLALYSEQFDNAAWVKSGSFITANTTIAPDGTTTADTYTASQTNDIYQAKSATTNTEYTFSVYVKLGTATNLCLVANNALAWNTIGGQSFNSSNGLNTSTWTRISFTFTTPSTLPLGLVNFHIGGNAETGLTQSSGTVFIWGAQIETGVTTNYIPTTTAAVSVGPVSNVPRLDYLGSSCPRLLLEPQRTNLALYSEQLNNAAWQSNLFGNWSVASVTANTSTAPDGTISADTISLTSPVSNVLQRISVTASTAYTYSIYVKALPSQNYNGQLVLRVSTGNSNTLVNENFQVVNISSLVSTTEWKRFDITFTVPASGVNQVEVGISSLNALSINANVLAWGAQLEAGSYATSYIPTLAASVTRVADAASKTGISSLIGQTEGTIYAEIVRTQSTATDAFWIAINDNSANNWIFIGTEATGGRAYVRASNTVIFDQYPAISIGRHKLAIAYKSGSIAVYIDGTQLFTSSATFTIGSLTGLNLGSPSATTVSDVTTAGAVNQALLFKTRLTNSQLAELTSL
jgi:hypothetical protein